ncbi:MAG: hypothetical protein MZV63_70990 [Marinilabiliales bacterium]|nr:hypothetical protein [Marinilabiliales bacterium]
MTRDGLTCHGISSSETVSHVLNTFIDRASVDFTAGTLQVSAGRQRINWSQALVWNPNDIFNTYSSFDFDYMERPGSDAVRVDLLTGAFFGCRNSQSN